MTNEQFEEAKAAMLQTFGTRVAAVCTYYGEENVPRNFFSCHFFDFNGQWTLVTAGHCLKPIREAAANGDGPSLILIFDSVTDAKAPLPIQLSFDRMVAIDEASGADYGFVPISNFYSEALAAAGTRPCEVENVAPSSEAFDVYFLFGYPFEHSTFNEGPESVKVNISQTVLRLERLDDDTSKTFPRLLFKCDLTPLPHIPDLNDIGGMSGGTVFGLRKNNAGGIEWGVVGIQSAWRSERQELLVCPHSVFFAAIRNIAT